MRASYAVKDIVAQYGGRALMNRVGHAFIKRRMREEDAIFGGEVTGHYYFRDNFYADNGFIPALLILELMSKKGLSLRDLLKPLRERYFISGEINTKVPSMDVVPKKIEALAEGVQPRPRLSSRWHLRGVRRLAFQRAGVEHRTAAAPEPGREDAGDHGEAARRGPGALSAADADPDGRAIGGGGFPGSAPSAKIETQPPSGSNSVVESQLPKLLVAGSIPVSRSNFAHAHIRSDFARLLGRHHPHPIHFPRI